MQFAWKIVNCMQSIFLWMENFENIFIQYSLALFFNLFVILKKYIGRSIESWKKYVSLIVNLLLFHQLFDWSMWQYNHILWYLRLADVLIFTNTGVSSLHDMHDIGEYSACNSRYIVRDNIDTRYNIYDRFDTWRE